MEDSRRSILLFITILLWVLLVLDTCSCTYMYTDKKKGVCLLGWGCGLTLLLAFTWKICASDTENSGAAVWCFIKYMSHMTHARYNIYIYIYYSSCWIEMLMGQGSRGRGELLHTHSQGQGLWQCSSSREMGTLRQNMYIHTHTHTHTHIYIYIYLCPGYS